MRPPANLLVFVSSTYEDLREERLAAKNVIDDLAREGKAIAWVGMEDFGSLAVSPLEASEAHVRQVDLVVLLLGGSYGSSAPDQRWSFTRAEYQTLVNEKLPCLAFLKDVGTISDPRVAAFRAQVAREFTAAFFRTPLELADKLRDALQRELSAYTPRPLSDTITSAPPLYPPHFVGRQTEAEVVSQMLKTGRCRLGVVGPAGSGKSTFVQHVFETHKADLYDPLWFRIEELTGRDAGGKLLLGASRWRPEELLRELTRLVAERPRAVLVFDNVQAYPRMAFWVAERVPLPSIFLSWDAVAVAFCDPIVRMPALSRNDARSLLEHYVGSDRTNELFEIDALADTLEGSPLLLSLVGRELRLRHDLTVSEVARDISAGKDLSLQGAGTASETVEIVLRRVYHALDAVDRLGLCALAACPSRGISEDTLAALSKRLDGFQFRRLVDLGLVDSRKVADWLGHRYRIRSITVAFVQGVDTFPAGAALLEDYLAHPDAARDEDASIATSYLIRALHQPQTPNLGTTLSNLLVHARPVVRARVGDALSALQRGPSLDAVHECVANLLSKPLPEEIALETIALAAKWDQPAPNLTRAVHDLWLSPEVQSVSGDDDEDARWFTPYVTVAAAKALAAWEGLAFDAFLASRLDKNDFKQALEAAAYEKVETVRAQIERLLESRSTKIRQNAVDALGSYPPDQRQADVLALVATQDPIRSVRQEAWHALGLWRDERAIPALFEELSSSDEDTRATAVSVLHRLDRSDVLERLALLATNDPSRYVRVNAVWALVFRSDMRAHSAILALIRSGDAYSRRVGVFCAGLLGRKTSMANSLKVQLWLALREASESSDALVRVIVAGARLRSRDPEISDSFLKDLQDPRARVDSYHWDAMRAAAEWAPPWLGAAHIAPFLHDSDPDMRKAAVLVAGQLGLASLTLDLESLLSDQTVSSADRATVAAGASEALDRIAGKRPKWTAPPIGVRP